MSSANSKNSDTTRSCSYCKRDVALANFVLHEAHCMRHIALCPQCKEPVPKAQLEEHIAQDHSKVPCTLCKKEFEQNELEDHKANNCGQRPVTCQYCEIELPLSKMEEHEDACGSRTEKCLTCQSYIMIKHAEEHKLSNCKPPEEEQDWEPEEEFKKFGYVDEYDRFPVDQYDRFPVDQYDHFPVDQYDDYPVDQHDDYDDMLPCEFCGQPYPFDFLIQHQSGCDQNAMRGNASSSAHQPRQVDQPEEKMRGNVTSSVRPPHQGYVPEEEMRGNASSSARKPRQVYIPEDDMSEDEIHSTVPELKDLNINPRDKDLKNVGENNLKPVKQENSHRVPPIDQKRTADRAPSVQSEKSTVEKKKIDKSHDMDSESARNETSNVKENHTSHKNLDSESARNETSTVKGNYASHKNLDSKSAQNETSTVKENYASHKNLDSKSAQNETSTVKENYTSNVDVIPCEFCDSPIELTRLMEHQKLCRWVHPNNAFKPQHFADEDEDDFDEARTRYQHRYQRGRGYAGTSRGFTNGNTRGTYERNSHGASMNKYAYTEKRSHGEVENDPDSASETSSYQPRSRGPSGYRNNHQDRRQTYAEDQPRRYKGRSDYNQSSRWQHEEQQTVRPLMDFESSDVRQRWQREDQRTVRQQPEDNHCSKGQQEQLDKPSVGRQVSNENPRSGAPRQEPDVPKGQKQEQANVRPEGQKDTEEQQKTDRGYQSQPRQQQAGVGQRRVQGAEDEVVSQSTRAQPEEENWRRKRPTDGQSQARFPTDGQSQARFPTDGQSQARFPRGRGRPAQNHSDTRSQRTEEENETPKEPAASTKTERTRGGQTQRNLRHDEEQEVRPRGGDDQGQTRAGRGRGRGRGRGPQNWRQERWNRTKGQAEEDYYDAPWPRRSNRDHNE